MRALQRSLLLLLGISLLACSSTKLDFLEGTWKVENKESYEVWKKTKGQLQGYSYQNKMGQQKITETLKIFKAGKKIFYEATVPDQNQGRSISFQLNPTVKDRFSFENLSHDFPQKIQYQKLNNKLLFIQVSGADGQGFSYNLRKQE